MPLRVRAAVVIVEGDRVAVIERRRAGALYFVLPGGGVEPGESVEHAAIREAKEELGVNVALLGPVATVRYTQGGHDADQHFFAAEIVDGAFGSGSGPEFATDLDPGKGSYRPLWLPIAEATRVAAHPRALISALERRGLVDLIRDPLNAVEVG